MDISVIIRTYNEQRYLPDLLRSLRDQEVTGKTVETIVVDSGSVDHTLEIAAHYGCRVIKISSDDFSFGRSLNVGCQASKGKYLAFVSGHCIPIAKNWLINLTRPLQEGLVVYVYGSQLGNQTSRFSECRIFTKYFASTSAIPQDGFFCNNANAALLRDVWANNQFDEDLTGLEDMELAKRLVDKGEKIGYVAEAPVYHLHHENWGNIKNRFEREALALQHIMPQVNITFLDFLRYFVSAFLLDAGAALEQRCLKRTFLEIIMYRGVQYLGSYKGNQNHRQISKALKDKYFYPK